MKLILSLILVTTAHAQLPHIGEINFYGLHQVTAEQILSQTRLRQGGSLPASKGGIEEAIDHIPQVAEARVEAVCCDGRSAALFIGIAERGAVHAEFRSEPAGAAVLPQPVVDAYGKYASAVMRAAAHGHAEEDLSTGHSVVDDADARALQPRFVSFAAQSFNLLHDVLRNGAEASQRAVAAAVIDYAAPSQSLVDDLEFALADADAAVRANALRSLTALAVFASKNPQAALKISPYGLVELLHSLELADRTESVKALLILTAQQDGKTGIDLLRAGALPDLAEMASWKTSRYAQAPFLLLARVAGMSDSEAKNAWASGNREAAIEKAVAGAKL